VAATTVVPLGIFYLTGRIFDLSPLAALTLSVVLIATGTGVTIQTLANLGRLHTRPGRFLTLVSALDDVPAALLMTVLLFRASVRTGDIVIPTDLLAAAALALAAIAVVLRRSFPYRSAVLAALVLGFGVAVARALEIFYVSLVMGVSLRRSCWAFCFVPSATPSRGRSSGTWARCSSST
jgi:Kef-type K+ transport system membrane component KefB